MRKYQSIFTYLLLFLALSLVLKFFGIISIAGEEIISYALIFYGIIDVYLSLGKNHKFSLFFGTVFFLVGILLFILNNFLIFWGLDLLLPSALFIPGIALLMLYLDDSSNKKFLAFGIFLISSAFIAILINGQFNFTSFYRSILNVTSQYWQIILVIAAILFLISLEDRK